MLRAKPHKIPRGQEFFDRSIVAVGWPSTGSIEGLDEAGIREALEAKYASKPATWVSNSLRDLLIFRDSMLVGDLVLAVPTPTDRSGRPMLGRISGPYQFDPTVSSGEEGYPHQRPVEWLRPGISRPNIPASIMDLLRRRGSIVIELPPDELETLALTNGWVAG